MNRKHGIAGFTSSPAKIVALCLVFLLSSCGGGGSGMSGVSGVPHSTKNYTVEPFEATTNFALLETQAGFPVDSSTGAGADWNVLSWGEQGGVIWAPFTITNPSSSKRLFSSSTLASDYDQMSVTFESDPAAGTWTSTTLNQTATAYCGSSPQEFDLFLQPNDSSFVVSNPSGILAASGYPTGSIPALSDITDLDFEGTVTVVTASQSGSTAVCAVNQSGALASLILTSTGGQTLFYQLDLASECYPGTDPSQGCFGHPPAEYFFFGSNPYGIDDPIISYGPSLLKPGGSITMNGVNIAPRLKTLISGGSPDGKMDTNPADWRVTDAYVGQQLWGQANLETKWSAEFLVQLRY